MSQTPDYLVFEVAGERWAVALSQVAELVRAVGLTRAPQGNDAIEGVFNLRGQLVPVVDVRPLLNAPAKVLDPGDCFIVLHARTGAIAVRVDRATGIYRGPLQHAGGVPALHDEQGIIMVPDWERLFDQALPARALA